MAFFELVCTARKLNKLKQDVVEEKLDAIKVSKKEKPRWRFRHITVDIRVAVKRFFKRALSCFIFERVCYNLRHDGSCENYTLKSLFGFIGGFLLTYIFFIFCVFQLDFKITTATIMCSVLGCVLTNGLAFSSKVRCIVLLTLPQFFSQRGRQALLAYAFILAISGPAKNTLNNMGILSESLACGQEQLKAAVRQIMDAIKKPFLALKDAIKKLVKTVKEIVKKIKEILLTIKRIIMAIVKVIKAAFEFLAKIINICNKELGTPFERCTRVFENAIADCNAKLGPLFNWLCSIAYIIKSVCYLVKFLDFVCMLVDFISNSVIGVVIRKVKTFIRHIRTMFYVRIKFSHSFQFQTNTSKTMAEVAHNIVAEIRQRTSLLVALFNFMTSAATLFFLFMIVKTTYYRFKFLTCEKFDNRFITKDFRNLDTRRAKMGRETVLPLNSRERAVYVSVDSRKLAKTEKKALSKAITTLGSATMKLVIFMAVDYCLFWIMHLIQYYGRFQSKVQAPNIPNAHISGNGLLADLLKGIVKAFQPLDIQLEIDTVPCLPIPIPPNFDRYVQIAILLVLCWILTLLEPYGLRLRHMVMCYYHPTRAKERAIWLYNHIMRSRNSFLKFARRQLRRKVLGDKGIEKITCKEYLAANFRIARLCLGEGLQTTCLLCGQVFRESDEKKPIRCQTPGCPGVYCEQCFSDLQNLCTVCLSPIEYGDMSDISEERDSSDDDPNRPKRRKKKDDHDTSGGETKTSGESPDEGTDGDESKDQKKPGDSDYYSSDSTEYSYTYQYEKSGKTETPLPPSFKDVEKQEIPEYVSMENFREELPAERPDQRSPSKTDVGTIISGTTFEENRRQRHIDFIGIPSSSSDSDLIPRKRPLKKVGDEIRFLEPDLCFCSDSTDVDSELDDEIPLITFQSTTSTTTNRLQSSRSSSTSDFNSVVPQPVELDPSVKDDLKYIHMMVPQLDLSELTQSEPSTSRRSYAEDKFSNVTYVVESETPSSRTSNRQLLSSSTSISPLTDTVEVPKKEQEPEEIIPEVPKKETLSSTTSNRQLSSSTNISPLTVTIEVPQKEQEPKEIVSEVPEKEQEPENINPVRRSIASEEIHRDMLMSSSVDSYNRENNQRKRVKQYYKAVKDIPSTEVEVKRKPSRFSRIVQKILPKRRKNPDELPLYSKNKEVVELKSFNYTEDQWDTLSTNLSSSAYVCQETSEGPENPTASSEDSEEGGRERGGASGLFRNRPTRRYKTGYIPLKKLPSVPPKPPITKHLLSKYFVSIEDLTPTRDCGPMSTAKTVQSVDSYDNGEALIGEVPEKDRPETPVTSATDTPASSASSVLSDSLCKSILGKACKVFHKNKTSKTSVESPKRDSLVVDTIYLNNNSDSNPPQKKLSQTSLLPEKDIAQGSIISTTSLFDTTEVITTSGQRRPSVSTQAEVSKQGSGNLDPTVQKSNTENTNALMQDFTPCRCEIALKKDQKLQTFPVPILKVTSPSEKNIITIKPETVPSQTSQSGIIEGKPKSDTKMLDTQRHHRSNHRRVSDSQHPVKDITPKYPNREKILLTSDKMQQTSDDDASNGAIAGSSSAGDYAKAKSSSATNHKPSSYLEAVENVQQTPSSSCLCACVCSDTTESNRTCNCCMRSAPSPPQYDCPTLKEKCYRSTSTREPCPACKEKHKHRKRTPSEHSIQSKNRRKTCRDLPTDEETCSCCSRRREGHSVERTRRSCTTESDRPRRRRSNGRESCSCTTEECECCMRMYQLRPSSPRRYCTIEYDTASSDTSEPTDDDDYFSDCPPNRFDLPYQNNDDYLELVQELEETLQSRNRNRVRRAMQEFEQRSKYNKPLEQPIINYDETSESEEPLIEKISKLTSEKKGCCGRDMCVCGRKSRHSSKGRQCKKISQRPKPGGYMCAAMCRPYPGSSVVKTHWQLDKNSGEWFKVSDHSQRHRSGRRSKTPSPQRGYCPYDCSCCGARRYEFR